MKYITYHTTLCVSHLQRMTFQLDLTDSPFIRPLFHGDICGGGVGPGTRQRVRSAGSWIVCAGEFPYTTQGACVVRVVLGERLTYGTAKA